MNKSVNTNVAIFLAATLVTGIFAMISPSFIDVEASGDKRDYKHKDRHAKSNGVNVKFICNQNNIDVGGIGIDLQTRDIASALTGAQVQEEEGNQELSANSMQNGERNHGERNQGFKQHDSKNIIFICNNNNNGNVPPVVVEDCLDCFITTNNGGFLPPGQLTNILEELESISPGADLQDLCDAIEAGLVSEEELLDFLNDALPGSQQRLVGLLFDCLSQFFPVEEMTTTP
jgi:hypothetical protein